MIVLALLALVPLLLTGPGAAALSLALIARGRRRALVMLWALLAGVAILLGIAIAHTFGDLLPGLGCFATLWTPAAIVLSLLVWRLQGRRLQTPAGPDAASSRVYQITPFVLIALQLGAPLVAFGYAQSCARLNRRAAQPIVAALDSYRTQHGRYPFAESRSHSDLSPLMPEHLETLPPLACRNPFARKDAASGEEGWGLYFCRNSPEQETLLLVPLIGTDSKQIYNPAARQWTRGNALDGYCP